MKLSAKMPAQMDSTLPAKMPATMPSDSQQTGDGGSDDAPQGDISQTTAKTVVWDAVDRERGINADAPDRKQNSPKDGYSTNDRKNTGEGGLPQRDPDNDGDLN